MPTLSSRSRWVLLFLLLAAWAWRLHGLDAQSLWRDETDTLRFATRPLAQVLGNFTRPGENGPLFFLLMKPWLAATGHSEFALRFPSALAGLLAGPLIFWWGRRLGGVRIALMGLLLLAVNPYHVWYSQEAKMYALVVTLVMLAMWAFVRAIERGGWRRWLVWWGLTTVTIYVHVLSVFIILLQACWLLLAPQWHRRWRSFALGLAALIGPYLPLIGWQWTLLTTVDFRTGHPFTPLDRLLLNLFAAQLQGIPPLPSPWLMALPILLVLAALVFTPEWPNVRRLLLAWWWLPALGVFGLSLVTPIFTDRYLIWTLPALLLLLAWGVRQVGHVTPRFAGLLLAGLILFQGWMGWQQKVQPIKSDFRSAAAYVAPRRQTGDLTLYLIPYIRYTYKYYDSTDFAWADAPYTNRPGDAAVLPAAMQTLSHAYTGVWVIESEGESYDQQGLIRTWLQAHGAIDDSADFTRVRVYHVTLNGDGS